jgi:nucleoside phosphorylase
MDVLLICALKDEYDQVRAVIDGLVEPGWVESVGPGSWIVADACFASPTGAPLSIRTSWASQMGRERAQAVASMLIQAHPAHCLAMSGICAGRRGKVALGDVIFADLLWSYDTGKSVVEDGEEKFQGDTLPYRPLPVWVQRMQNMAVLPTATWLEDRPALPLEQQEDWILLQILASDTPSEHPEFEIACPDWSAAVARLWKRKWLEKPLVLTDAGRARATELLLLYPKGLPAPPSFQLHVAPIATGAAVTEDEGIFPRLVSVMRKVLAVEMEASALGALGEMHNLPVVVAKAVSDYGDQFKDDRYRKFAARAAAEHLIAFLRSAIDLLSDRVGTDTTVSPRSDLTPVGSGVSEIKVPQDLIHVLAEHYPDVRDARALWERAGGKGSEVENVSRPRDLWQRLWVKSTQGASVRPVSLLKAALEELPNNAVLLHHIAMLS